MLGSNWTEIGQVRELEAISELTSRAADPLDPLRAELIAGIAASAGLHPASLDRLVAMWSAGWQRPDLERAYRRGLGAHPGAFRPIGTVAIVAPGNLCVATWQAIVEALLAGNHVSVRPGSGDPLAAANFKAALQRIDPGLANRLSIQQFERGDVTAWLRWLVAADAVVVYGGDAAIAAILQLASEAGYTGRLRLHGHYQSIGLLTSELLGDPDALRMAIAGWAVDALLADGRGCMSLRALWWVGVLDAAKRAALRVAFAEAFARAAQLFPAGQLAPAWQATARLEAEAHAFVAAQRDDRWLEQGDGWTILGSHGPIPAGARALGPGARTLAVYEAQDARDLQKQLMPWRGKLSTASVSLDADHDGVLGALDRLGVHRTCQPGAMQAPRADRAPDGHMPFAGLVRLTDRV